MNTQSKENFVKKLASIAGVASASVVLSFPAFAVTNADASSANQPLNNRTAQADLVAQQSGSSPSTPGGGNNTTNQSPSMGGSNNINQRSTTGGVNNADQPSTGTSTTGTTSQIVGTSTMEENGRINRRLVTGGDSVRGVIFRCLNNPNPGCGI